VTAGQTATTSFSVDCPTPPPPTGSLTVSTSTSGGTPDPDGYSVTVSGGGSQTIGDNDSVTFPDLATGSHTVTLSGIASNCSVSGGTSQTVNVPAGGSATVSFTITCQAVTGSLTVSTSTSGPNAPSGYTFSIDGGASQNIGANASVTVSGLTAGNHTVQLNGVPSNCSLSEANPQSVAIPAGGSAQASFTITCQALTGDLTVNTSTSGPNQPSSYTVSVNGGGSQTIDANGSVTFTGLSTGSHTVSLSGVPGNCSVSGGTSHSANVPAGGTGSTSFTITCQALTGDLTVNTSTSGPNQPSSYTVSVTGGGSQTIDANGSVTFTGLAAGSHTVSLSGVPGNCSVSGGSSKSVNVPSGGTAQANFAITCTAPNQPPTAEFSASCTNLQCSFSDASSDPDGSITSWRWDFGDGGTSSSRNPSHGYSQSGTYTVTLTVTDNDGASNSVSHTVNVSAPPPPNQPPVVSAGGDQSVLVGALFSLSGASFSDPDHNGPWTVTINWGDGSSSRFTASEGSINASHSYITILPASYTLTITVTDPGGLSGSDSKTVKVTTL
jgi:PKD repeat protein